jgi:hypothetical protein|tara:strand:+ start:3607 stop:3921 length:315 start_codon:yes stop_codon:yes gene_type:complete
VDAKTARGRGVSHASIDATDHRRTPQKLTFPDFFSNHNSSKVEKMTAALTAASAAALANPLVAEAAMTPSLKNTLLSVAAGGIVLAAIGVAVVGVSTFDKIGRK